jgi:hypothetical protein
LVGRDIIVKASHEFAKKSIGWMSDENWQDFMPLDTFITDSQVRDYPLVATLGIV